MADKQTDWFTEEFAFKFVFVSKTYVTDRLHAHNSSRTELNK